MSRKVLLIEPNYKNKYPPVGIMKLATYYRMLGDDVTFFKGDLRNLILEECCNNLLKQLYEIDKEINWKLYRNKMKVYLQRGFQRLLAEFLELSNNPFVKNIFVYYRKYYREKLYFKKENRQWDIVAITTLFTFHWDITIDTINFAKKLCKTKDNVIIGGIMSTLLSKEIEKETGIIPIKGLLNKPGILDDNDIVIDTLSLDYSILDEIDYKYPAADAFFAYTTRGCINKCCFCAVPDLEPEFIPYIPIMDNLMKTRKKFGEKRSLILLDNNILASPCFDKIIDEIKACGFEKGATYTASNKYKIAYQNLLDGYNEKASIRAIVNEYKSLIKKNSENSEISTDIQYAFNKLNDTHLLSVDTATSKAIINMHNIIKPLFNEYYSKRPRKRFVDFNQGLDAMYVTDAKMKKMAEIAVEPIRIAFDSWKEKTFYEKAIRTAARNGHKNLSNYLLYNYTDKPIELYQRLKLNVELCEELNVSIYSFPMKYHPIGDSNYFSNRDYLGKHWNRKFIRTIQAILNSTKGKVGKGKSFFEKAFGKTEEKYYELLYMPEAMIIYRIYFESTGLTEQWRQAFFALDDYKATKVKTIIEKNIFTNIEEQTNDPEIKHLLNFYLINRKDAEINLN